MRLRLWGTPAETIEAAELLGELFGMTVTALTQPEPDCGYVVAEVPSTPLEELGLVVGGGLR